MNFSDSNFTIVDTETTGGKPGFHRVIEIGVIRVERGEIASTYSSLVNPKQPIPEFISGMTGITNVSVSRAPLFAHIARDVLALFENSVLVAHNSSFDYGFLRQEFLSAGHLFQCDTLCSVRLSRMFFPQFKKHNLSALIDRYHFCCSRRHRALDDAMVVWDFMRLLRANYSEAEVAAVLARALRTVPPAPRGSGGFTRSAGILPRR